MIYVIILILILILAAKNSFSLDCVKSGLEDLKNKCVSLG